MKSGTEWKLNHDLWAQAHGDLIPSVPLLSWLSILNQVEKQVDQSYSDPQIPSVSTPNLICQKQGHQSENSEPIGRFRMKI